ncbi:MAG: helix-turn-helix domain-containing protein [Calothrix sp. MO_167.B12]|nr:helix-turn-helix domain-containing protein [Calothrix sp. MO_167.B12]
MPKRITIVAHANVSELEQLYRQAKNGIASRQFQIIWLLAQGKTTEEVEEITGYSRTWIYALVKRYNELGIEGLGDRRSQNQGAKPLIGDVEQARLWQVLQGDAPDGGLWNGRKVADWLSSVTGKKISRQRGWEILRQMTSRLRVPRPSHGQSNTSTQEP